MVKSILILLFTVFGLILNAQTAELTIVVTDIELIKDSKIMVAVYNSEETFFDSEKVYRVLEVPVDSSAVVFTLSNMPEGVYAITMFHDEDNDDEMDRKWYGPPKEGYAFSNNFTSNIRPARFDDASFELTGDKTMEIRMVY